MTRDELLALSIFTSYFLLIAFLFTLIVRSLWRMSSLSGPGKLGLARLFTALTAISFAHTWYCKLVSASVIYMLRL